MNSSIDIEGVVADVNYTNIERLISGTDLILDGLDNRETGFLINDVSLKHKIPWVSWGCYFFLRHDDEHYSRVRLLVYGVCGMELPKEDLP